MQLSTSIFNSFSSFESSHCIGTPDYQGDHLTRFGTSLKVRRVQVAGQYIVIEHRVFDVQFARVAIFKDRQQTGYHFNKNGVAFEIYGEAFFNSIHKFVILSNFHFDFQINRRIGTNHYLNVYLIKHRVNGAFYVAKMFDKRLLDQTQAQALVKETTLLQEIDHPGLASIEYLYECSLNVIIVMKHIPGFDMYQVIGKKVFDESETRSFALNMLKTLQYLHQEKNIIHRDIKPSNIILNGDNPVLIDFGLADHWNQKGEYLFTKCGTPGFVAPEVLQDKPYDHKVDLYSLGVIIFSLLAGRHLFPGKGKEEILKLNYVGAVNLDKLDISPVHRDFLMNLLASKPESRMSAQEALAHPFIKYERNATVSRQHMRCLGSRKLLHLPPIKQLALRSSSRSRTLSVKRKATFNEETSTLDSARGLYQI